MCCTRNLTFSIFFFFQAEDGIRDIGVTGVQTCALPISRRGWPRDQAILPGPAHILAERGEGLPRRDDIYWLGRVGGPLREITFEAIVPSAWRGVPTKARRALQNHFELPPDELAWVMNEWRQRALALSPSRAKL